jgi:hypothetical protein
MTGEECVFNYFKRNPNIDAKTADVVDWVNQIWKRKKNTPLRDPDRGIRKLAEIGILKKQSAGLYRYTPSEVSPDLVSKFKDVDVYPDLNNSTAPQPVETSSCPVGFEQYLAAIRTKPFVLLAGISGTGKSRLVRQLAKATCPPELMKENKRPGNFEMIQVRPNWHDSTELMGYVSRVSVIPQFVMTPFVRFLAEAWYHENVPFFLCLDEMNLAPVEQYFAEYLSVIETRHLNKSGQIETDVLVRFDDQALGDALKQLLSKDQTEDEIGQRLKKQFSKEGGIRIPPNLIVMGTVNMDETTFSFSRKVLDRAMSIELNNVDLDLGVTKANDENISIPAEQVLPLTVTASDVYADNEDVCNKALSYLKVLNEHLESTPFKVAYRTRNEVLVYAVNRTAADVALLAKALDEITSMKILSRIEGDEQRIDKEWLRKLPGLISAELKKIDTAFDVSNSVSLAKLSLMEKQLERGYVSFWT